MDTVAAPYGHRTKIVTLTMNPALDITTSAEQVRPTDKIRCQGARYDPGGGGINVARVARVLGAPAVAVFPVGGQAGDMLTNLLAEEGVPFHGVNIAGITRESFTVNEESTGQQYRFVLPGPRLSFAERAQCVHDLRYIAKSAQFVVASGSLPVGVPNDFYQCVADVCRDIGARLILDTSGTGLQHVTSGVFLLKPSVRELRECVRRELTAEQDQIDAARELIQRGFTENVVVSVGAEGALLVTRQDSQRFPAIHMRSGSGVGAGDAMVAAITVGLTRGWPLAKSVRYGIAAGAAMLMTPGTAVCNRGDVERIFDLVAAPADLDATCP
ncbi:phosphofructokinase [Mycobacterium kyorinense]|uniref:Phosphofructokinase n=1 Tax=Mycobacterium kyorinense TaxID=487514 RepID=A0A1A2YTL1_9MYCO|nr:1-phosphofructokinase family hexose kinase [Mycobacterium kyorinense]OBI40266.1 phosphofructokinase [Mycobacterium kyorinense]